MLEKRDGGTSTEWQSENDSLITRDIVERYQASSPDEKAILEGCAKLGLILKGSDNNVLQLCRISHNGDIKELHYERLQVLEFSSERKRMSVIVRDENDTIWLYSKGAETSILPRCLDSPLSQLVDAQITEYAKQGLRTLAVARKQLTQAEYARFVADCQNANIELVNRQELIAKCYESIEVGKFPAYTLYESGYIQSASNCFLVNPLQALNCWVPPPWRMHCRTMSIRRCWHCRKPV